MKVVSSWGVGLREIIEVQKEADARHPRTDHRMNGGLTIERNL